MEGTRLGPVPASRWLVVVGILAIQLGTDPGRPAEAAGLRISNHYSPLNAQRPLRERTDYIVLHTTEGGDRSSLDRVRRAGLAHYVVMTDGRVLRTIERQRIARHAGLSMWNGQQELDLVSIGIEVVGYHNRPLNGRQETALRELLRQLKTIYRIPDERVLSHSMVAYGNRNRWHRQPHRGRKRCGMLFAQPDLRERLGLASRPTRDPDVAAGRLINADPHLATVLYAPAREAQQVAAARFSGPEANVITADRTAWFIARDEFDHPHTVYVFPNGRRQRGNEIRDWSRIPAGTRVLLGQDAPAASAWLVLGRDGRTASELAGSEYAAPTTLYVRPDGRVLRGDQLQERDFRSLPVGTRVFLGFRYAGTVTRNRTAYELAGPRFRLETTLYLLPGGTVRTGQQIRENRIPGGTLVLLEA
jgi:N-acetylmuramoyl-L-alanine amidase